MLGNFSFGDYFKEEAIDFAWTYLTKEIGLPPERLWVTVFGGGDGLDADHEARQIWKKVSGLGDDRILDMDAKDNFWSMGERTMWRVPKSISIRTHQINTMISKRSDRGDLEQRLYAI